MSYPAWAVQYGYRQPIAAETIGAADAALTSVVYVGLPIEDRPSINPGLIWDQAAKARGKPYKAQTDRFLRGKLPTFEFTCPATAYYLADMLYSLFQNITTEDVTPFRKTFDIPLTKKEVKFGDTVSATLLPYALDFVRSNTLLSGAGTDLDEILIDGVVTKIVLTFDGILKMQVSVTGFDADVSAANFSGTISTDWNTGTGKTFHNQLFWEVGDVVIPVQSMTLTLDSGASAGVFPYQRATPHTIAVAPSADGWSNTHLSIGIPLDHAAVNDLFSSADPSVFPFGGGSLTGTVAKFELYGPLSTSDQANVTNGIEIDMWVAIESALTSGTDQSITTLECALSWDQSNEPLRVSVTDGTNRAFV